MDSLLASYASSDEEDEQQQASEPKSSASISIDLPPPKTKPSLFSALPPPKTPTTNPQPSSSSLFSSLPPPKTQIDLAQPTQARPKKAPPLDPNPKKVIQFTLPLKPSDFADDEDDDDEKQKQRKPIKDLSAPAPSKGLSSMLPAPKNSLCLGTASRKSAFDSDIVVSAPNPPERVETLQEQESGSFEGGGSYYDYPVQQGVSGYENYGGYDGSYVSGDYGGYKAENWSDGSVGTVAVPEMERRIVGKRGRNEIPAEIVEVNQAELMKNRPREDQVKVTGIAFGPAYQPASTSKGKPSKLHKRKHQIGSLYFDMRQKEMELAERRAKGFLTKAETQAKYGW